MDRDEPKCCALCLGTYSDAVGHTDIDGNSNDYADKHSNAYEYLNTDCDTNCDSHPNEYADQYTYVHTYADGNPGLSTMVE